MTVIACSRVEMAGDTQITECDGTKTPTKKIYRLADGSLLGIAGCVKSADKYITWEENGRKGRPPGMSKIDILKLCPDGRIFIRYSTKRETEVDRGFHAIGAGRHAAMAILETGGSPAKAVETANALIEGCSGLQVEKLDNSKR